jgi:hypothetical protein
MSDDEKDSGADTAAEHAVNASDHAEHLIKLYINESSNSQAWTRFLIVIQGGLATALGYILLSRAANRQSLLRQLSVSSSRCLA